MSATQAPPTATDRLRELLDLIDREGPREAARLRAFVDGVPLTSNDEYAYLFGALNRRARYALDEWEGRL